MNLIRPTTTGLVNDLIFWCCILTGWFLFPILAIPVLLFVCYRSGSQISSLQKHLILGLIALGFGLLGYTCEPGGSLPTDIVRYRIGYEASEGLDFASIIPVNYLFNVVNWLLVNHISNNSQAFGLFWCSIAYFFSLLTIDGLICKYLQKRGDLPVIFVFLGLCIIPLTMMTELVKQAVCCSLISYGIVRKLTDKSYGWFFVLCGLLIHMSSVFIVLIYFFDKKPIYRLRWFILAFCSIFLFMDVFKFIALFSSVPLFQFLDIEDKLNAYSDFASFGGSRRYYILFGFYFLQCICCYLWNTPEVPRENRYVRMLAILSLSVLCLNFSNNHNFARLLFLWFPFQLILLAPLLDNVRVRIRQNRLLIFALFGSIYFLGNIIMIKASLGNNGYTQKYMNGNLTRIVTSNVSQYLNFKVSE